MKPGIPKGTRDFSPEQVRKRNYIFETIRKVFAKYGYQPIETPTIELLSTLTGKYGDEGDKLLFKVLNNGDFLAKADKEALANLDSNRLTPSIAKRGLRYDLTVPFARYVVMNQHDIAFPFKRYQIQPVWRADRPQKGRYREFYQCDVDVVGSDSLVYEAELIQIYDEAFADLGLDVVIRINNRKILNGIAEAVGAADKFVDMTVAIDKLDKIGEEGVLKELKDRGINAGEKILELLKISDLAKLRIALADSPTGSKGVEELTTFFEFLNVKETTNEVQFDPSLARGLSYYTGCIMEVNAKGVKMGSIGGGGRYDDLTGNFGLKDVSGVGVSFGAARIYDVMEELNLFPEQLEEELQLLFLPLDDVSLHFAFSCATQCRTAGINSEVYPDPVKLKKQMKYANARKAPYVVIIGESERASGQLSLKNMITGEQEPLDLKGIIAKLSA